MNKRCFKCGQTKAITLFYKHPAMGDGRLGKCIECTKSDVRTNYANRREKYHDYERRRNQRPERRAKMREYDKLRRLRNPEKARAWSAVHNAIRDGRLVRQPCRICASNERVQAHHEDYSKPLEVDWLCFKCHREHAHGQTVSATA